MKKKKAVADKSPVKTPVKSGPRRKATRKSADSSKSGQTGFKPDQTESVIEEFRRRWPELNESRLEAHRQLRLVHDQLISKPGVTGLHVGLKKKGESADAPGNYLRPLVYAIRIHVRQKFSDRLDPRIAEFLPAHIGDIPTDVIQRVYSANPASSNAVPGSIPGASPNSPDEFFNPVIGGIAIAPKTLGVAHWGTLGKLFYYGNQIAYLTNQHVVGPPGSQVIQPPSGVTPDGSSEIIGTVAKIVDPADSLTRARIDAAVILASGIRKRRSAINGLSAAIFTVGQLTEGDKFKTAFKIGAKTGKTEGIVQTVSATVVFNDRTMVNQIIVEPVPGSDADLCSAGDSGSLLCVERTSGTRKVCEIVGLVHAEGDGDGSGRHRSIIACHIKDVMNYFGLRLDA